MTTTPRRTVAVFDLDGTLSRSDTLLPFLRHARGGTRTSLAVLVHSPRVVRALVSAHHRHGAKEALLVRLLRGQDVQALAQTAESFADLVATHRLRPEIVDRVERHRRAGHELVIVSASPELYVEPIGRRLGFDAVLATRLEADPLGRLTGGIAGLNCRGPEKVARLRAWLGDDPSVVYAYGDSAGDRELLASADAAFRLGRGGVTGGFGRSRRRSERPT